MCLCVCLRSQVPFTLNCNTSGRFRWVTTTIARFDVDSPGWPTDLNCSLLWNTFLTTYDGKPGSAAGCAI